MTKASTPVFRREWAHCLLDWRIAVAAASATTSAISFVIMVLLIRLHFQAWLGASYDRVKFSAKKKEKKSNISDVLSSYEAGPTPRGRG